MKVCKRISLLTPFCALLALHLAACEEKPDSDAEPKKEEAANAEMAKPGEAPKTEVTKAAEPAPAPPPAPMPSEVCNSLVAAIKAKDEAKLMQFSNASAASALGAEGAKEHVMMRLASGSCGAAKVDGEMSTVMVTSSSMGGTAAEAPQEVPFVKEGAMWKFDAASYLTKYPPMDKNAKKKGKDAKGHDHGKMHPAMHGKKHKSKAAP